MSYSAHTVGFGYLALWMILIFGLITGAAIGYHAGETGGTATKYNGTHLTIGENTSEMDWYNVSRLDPKGPNAVLYSAVGQDGYYHAVNGSRITTNTILSMVFTIGGASAPVFHLISDDIRLEVVHIMLLSVGVGVPGFYYRKYIKILLRRAK